GRPPGRSRPGSRPARRGSDARGRRSRAGLVAILVATGLAAGPGSTAGPPGGLRRAQAQPQPTEADAAAIHLPAVLAAAGASDLATPRAPGPGATPSARSSEPATPTLTTTPGARASATADPTAASSPTGAPTPHIVVEGQEVRSAHYALHVEVLDGREIGQLLEALHPQLTAHFGGAPAEILRGGIYADRPSYVAALAADGIQDPGGGGYYAPQTRKFYLFVQPSDHYSRQLTIHEATHQFHYLAGTENRGASGGWYVEGLAEYFGMHAWDGERLETGVVPWVTLEDYPAQALARFDARGQDLAALIADRGDWPRPPGWALVHFLMHTRPDEAKALFERLDRREDPTEAWEAVFGPVDGAWADAYRAWLVGHQQPWQEVWRAFQQWGDALEGKSGVNAIALLKQTPQRLAVEIEPVSGSLRAGLVFGYRSSGDFHLFQVLADGRVWVLRFADGQWTFLHQGQAAEPGPDGRHRLAIEQGDAELRLLANGVEVTRLAAEGRLGLNVDGCRVRFHLR
ncbi:MAG: hypothetical protein KDH92_14915, partial [Chloroflexi bacterium]|nr:hypothetical protein [Chloroflexota bacterium]